MPTAPTAGSQRSTLAWRPPVTDGASWSAPVTGAGFGQLTAVDLPGVTAREVRITQTGTAPQWWTLADLRLCSQGGSS